MNKPDDAADPALEAHQAFDPAGATANFARDEAIFSEGTFRTIPKAFPLVEIGACAGGVAAFESLFAGMPTDDLLGMECWWCSTSLRITPAS
jgi:chemotaxis response regulator CheB